MSEDLMQEIVRVFESVSALGDTQHRFDEMISAEVARLWNDNAELRDELHTLANRVDTLTRARLTEPAEVAEAIQRGNIKPEPFDPDAPRTYDLRGGKFEPVDNG